MTAHDLPARVWHTVREYAGHWMIAGAVLAATGAAPEHWFADLLHDVHVPTDALHLWAAGIDLRLILVGAGVLMIAGDIAWRQKRPRSDAPAAARQPNPDALPLPDRPSIAVLPFANLSGDPEQEYFSDGVADDIITELSRERALFVIARNSSFTYKGRNTDVRQIAHEIGVRYILEGSVRRGGERMRINAQLIDAVSGEHVWAERYDRNLADVFAVQDEITAAVTAAIRPAIGEAEQRRASRKPPGSLDAWETYQRGLWHMGRGTLKDNDTAKQFFRRAAAMDAAFAAPRTAMALACMMEGAGYVARALPEAVAEAGIWAQQAVSLDPGDADAHAMLAMARLNVGDMSGAEERARLAKSCNPGSALAWAAEGWVLLYTGRPEKARDSLNEALRLDPHGPSKPAIVGQM